MSILIRTNSMNHIEKSIFDTLARRRGINLPGVGSLSVVHVPAEFITDSSIRPPHNKIIFSPSANPQYVSAGDMEGYKEWLQHTEQGRGVREINGVGVIKGNIFYPSVELHGILNPHGTQPVAVKPRYRFKRKIAVGAGVAAAAAVAIMAVIFIDRFAGANMRAEENMEGTAALVKQEAEGAASRGESTIEAAVASGIGEEIEAKSDISAPVQSAPDADGPHSGQGSPERGMDTEESLTGYAPTAADGHLYYLVVGVFSEPQNADKLISRDPLGIGSSNYRKAEFRNGKILVSAFSSPDREEVERRRRELSSINRDLWIYEKK